MRLPSLRSAGDGDQLQTALAEIPDLEALDVRENYGPPRAYRHASADVTVPFPRPWPPRDQLPWGSTITISLPRDLGSADLHLHECILAMERTFDKLSAPERASCTDFWTLVRGPRSVQDPDAQPIPMVLLASVLAACADEFLEDGWRALSRTLAATRWSANEVARVRASG